MEPPQGTYPASFEMALVGAGSMYRCLPPMLKWFGSVHLKAWVFPSTHAWMMVFIRRCFREAPFSEGKEMLNSENSSSTLSGMLSPRRLFGPEHCVFWALSKDLFILPVILHASGTYFIIFIILWCCVFLCCFFCYFGAGLSNSVGIQNCGERWSLRKWCSSPLCNPKTRESYETASEPIFVRSGRLKEKGKEILLQLSAGLWM